MNVMLNENSKKITPKIFKKIDVEKRRKIIKTFDIEKEGYFISGILNKIIELNLFEVYISIDCGKNGIFDVSYKKFSNEKDAIKFYELEYQKVKRTLKLQDFLQDK